MGDAPTLERGAATAADVDGVIGQLRQELVALGAAHHPYLLLLRRRALHRGAGTVLLTLHAQCRRLLRPSHSTTESLPLVPPLVAHSTNRRRRDGRILGSGWNQGDAKRLRSGTDRRGEQRSNAQEGRAQQGRGRRVARKKKEAVRTGQNRRRGNRERPGVRTTATRRRDRKGRGEKRPSRRATVMRRRLFFSRFLFLFSFTPARGGSPKCPGQQSSLPSFATALGSPPTSAAVFPLALCLSSWFFVERRGGQVRVVTVWDEGGSRWSHGGQDLGGQSKEQGTVKSVCLWKAAVLCPRGTVHQIRAFSRPHLGRDGFRSMHMKTKTNLGVTIYRILI
jgi:hypothetical protein